MNLLYSLFSKKNPEFRVLGPFGGLRPKRHLSLLEPPNPWYCIRPRLMAVGRALRRSTKESDELFHLTQVVPRADGSKIMMSDESIKGRCSRSVRG